MLQPKLIHFTEGGPFHGYLNQEYTQEWISEFCSMVRGNNPEAEVEFSLSPDSIDFGVRYGRPIIK